MRFLSCIFGGSLESLKNRLNWPTLIVFYGAVGEDDVSHADFLMELGYDWFLIFTNTGQLLLRIHRPDHEVVESLANFSRSRRPIDGWHYDVAAFPRDREDVCDRIWQQYSKCVIREPSQHT